MTARIYTPTNRAYEIAIINLVKDGTIRVEEANKMIRKLENGR